MFLRLRNKASCVCVCCYFIIAGLYKVSGNKSYTAMKVAELVKTLYELIMHGRSSGEPYNFARAKFVDTIIPKI